MPLQQLLLGVHVGRHIACIRVKVVVRVHGEEGEGRFFAIIFRIVAAKFQLRCHGGITHNVCRRRTRPEKVQLRVDEFVLFDFDFDIIKYIVGVRLIKDVIVIIMVIYFKFDQW